MMSSHGLHTGGLLTLTLGSFTMNRRLIRAARIIEAAEPLQNQHLLKLRLTASTLCVECYREFPLPPPFPPSTTSQICEAHSVHSGETRASTCR